MLSALTTLAVACGELSEREAGEQPLSNGSGETILVIGAGMAGLGAARRIQDAGHAVTVIEGRKRIGGRVWTSRLWEDSPVVMGSSWFHGVKGNPMTALADAAQITRVETDYDNAVLYNTNGRAVGDALWDELEQQYDALMAAVADEVTDGMTLLTAIEATDLWSTYSEETRRHLRFLLNTTIEQEFAGGIGEISAVNPDDAEEFRGGDEVFPDGYGRIADYLARGLDLNLGQIVERIRYDDAGVVVETDQALFEADRVIVTLPIGVLKRGSVQFEPQLPSEKQAAIATLGVGLLDKLYLRFPTLFWDERVEFIEWISVEPGRWNEWLNLAAYTGQPILLGFNAADYARKITPWNDAEVVADAMAVLRTIYGDNIPEPESWQRSRWSADQFAYGSYSFNAVNADRETRLQLAKTVANRLFFAGEATSADYPATVHGAYLSGLRAAGEILAL
jgi:monoamine oxidase